MNRADQFIPHLIVNDGPAALEFYKDVFGAEEGASAGLKFPINSGAT
ncbi:MAG: hypothetical protein LC729_04050 [Acidobacteria bacterium]|nr:hypothetical protein [Acidobacteriota bacterium]